MYTIGIDVGGTNIKIGLVHDGKVVQKQSIEALAHQGLLPRLKDIEDVIRNILSAQSVDIAKVSGIGMCVPGIVDSKGKKILVINDKFNDVVNMDLAQWAKSVFNLPLAIDNDARCALISEWQYGAGRDCDNLVMITLGTGIGTSALVEGRVMRGSHYVAGILGGHVILDRNGLMCNCGNRGCGEAQASTWNMDAIIRQQAAEVANWYSPAADFRLIFEKAAGDVYALKVRNHCLDIWTEVIVNMVYAYDPEKIVMAGGIMKSADVIIPYITEKIKTYGWALFDRIEIVRSSVTDDAALLSAEYFMKEMTS
ncbi:MAG: ROK family protein [Prevotella sp.]|jgi:glucokinase|nr:ROK family protein [Prevotella sp.]